MFDGVVFADQRDPTGTVDVGTQSVANAEPGGVEGIDRERDLVFATDSSSPAPSAVLYLFHIK